MLDKFRLIKDGKILPPGVIKIENAICYQIDDTIVITADAGHPAYLAMIEQRAQSGPYQNQKEGHRL